MQPSWSLNCLLCVQDLQCLFNIRKASRMTIIKCCASFPERFGQALRENKELWRGCSAGRSSLVDTKFRLAVFGIVRTLLFQNKCHARRYLRSIQIASHACLKPSGASASRSFSTLRLHNHSTIILFRTLDVLIVELKRTTQPLFIHIVSFLFCTYT